MSLINANNYCSREGCGLSVAGHGHDNVQIIVVGFEDGRFFVTADVDANEFVWFQNAEEFADEFGIKHDPDRFAFISDRHFNTRCTNVCGICLEDERTFVELKIDAAAFRVGDDRGLTQVACQNLGLDKTTLSKSNSCGQLFGSKAVASFPNA